MRSVFSESFEDVRLEQCGPPGHQASAQATERAATRLRQGSQTALQHLLTDLLNALWPSGCRLCGGPMLSLSRAAVCDACIASVQPQDDREHPLCSRCGEALGMESARFAAALGVTECTLCRLAPPEFARAVAFAEYDAEVREMLHLLKFSGQRSVAQHVLGHWLAGAILKLEPHAARELLVIPVPLFAARERRRGFNQATLLAEAATKRLRRLRPAWKLRLEPSALLRVKDTHALFTLQPHQRRHSLRGAFRAGNPEILRGREVLLIDDILTTGATARECARVLLRAGAAKVWVATVARAQPESIRLGQLNSAPESAIARWDAPHAAAITTTAAQQEIQ